MGRRSNCKLKQICAKVHLIGLQVCSIFVHPSNLYMSALWNYWLAEIASITHTNDAWINATWEEAIFKQEKEGRKQPCSDDALVDLWGMSNRFHNLQFCLIIRFQLMISAYLTIVHWHILGIQLVQGIIEVAGLSVCFIFGSHSPTDINDVLTTLFCNPSCLGCILSIIQKIYCSTGFRW